MVRSVLGLTWVGLFVMACTTDVDVGGPRASEAGAAGAGDEPGAQPDDPAKYADGQAPCTTDADCCVVFDGCLAEAYVVGIADRDKLTELIAGLERDSCKLCIPPAIELSCVAGKCRGREIELGEEWSLTKDHCGSQLEPADVPAEGSMFDCAGGN